MRRQKLWAAALTAVMAAAAVTGLPAGVPASDSMAAEAPAEEYDLPDTELYFEEELPEEVPDREEYDEFSEELPDSEYPDDDEDEEPETPEPEAAEQELFAESEAEELTESTAEELTEELSAEEHFARGEILVTTDLDRGLLEAAGFEITAEEASDENGLKGYWTAGKTSYALTGIPADRSLRLRTADTGLSVRTEAVTDASLSLSEDGSIFISARTEDRVELELTAYEEDKETVQLVDLEAAGQTVAVSGRAGGVLELSGAEAMSVTFEETAADGTELCGSTVDAAKTAAAATYRFFREEGLSYLIQE